MKILSVRAELSYDEGRTDGQTQKNRKTNRHDQANLVTDQLNA